MHIVCVGECTIDRYLDLGRDYIGGISLNAAVNARRLGAHVSLVSAVGNDAGGAQVRAKLHQEGIQAEHVVTLPGPTGHQDIRILPGGERLFPPGGYSAGVLADLQLSLAALDVVRAADLVLIPIFRQIVHLYEQIVALPDRRGMLAADLLDGGDLGTQLEVLPGYLEQLDLAFISGDAALLERVRPFAQTTACLLVVTMGAHGAAALAGDVVVVRPAEPVAMPVDTTGCGDAFQAAFALTYASGGDLRAALDAGARQAAQVIQHYGATG